MTSQPPEPAKPAGPGSSMRAAVVAVPEHLSDVPTERMHLDSEALRKVGAAAGTAVADVAVAAARSAPSRRLLAALLMAAGLGGGGVGAVAVEVSTASECDRAMVLYLMHMGAQGEAWAVALEAEGRPIDAAHVRDMTSPSRLPNDLQLCVLLERRTAPDAP